MKRFFKSVLFLMTISIMLISCRETTESKEGVDDMNTEMKVKDDGDKIKIKTDDEKIKIKIDEDGDVKKKVKIDD
ncbi:MAG: hypothetical protein JJE07_02085 [Flavobacteriaceae bacterium]|nr:hypothetical protein [Flavobacteriaceae bacterium]